MPTKTRILDAAERLFGRQGFEATSLRQVTREADVNLAAVHYHFGAKTDLLRAVVERRVDQVNRERLETLEALEREHGAPLGIERVLEAFLGPPLRHTAEGEGWSDFMAVVGRLNTAGGEAFEALASVFQKVRDRFLPAISAALPELSPADVGWRFHFLVGLMCNVMIDRERIARMTGGLCDSTDPEATLRELVAFAAAGLGAPAATASETETRP